MNELPAQMSPAHMLALLFFFAAVPFMAIMMTSFTKLAIVFSLIRNALGTQQVPPGGVISGLALIFSVYIMSPVISDCYDVVKTEDFASQDVQGMVRVIEKAKVPFTDFLKKHARKRERKFFAESIKHLWPDKRQYDPDDLIVLIPAFAVSELTSAFEIGFLIYLPFIVIDMIISNILLAMGMMMVSPIIISVPFKLLLFVTLEGWTRIIHALILTYR
ncbi:MAG: type III secretion system export apparatus subunit SctR [Desulfobacteraceae bacterium]|jgi:type III secretion protein R